MLWLLLLQVWASCLWLGHGKVVTSFNNTCDRYFYEKRNATEGLLPDKPAWICQTLNNQHFYATLYDKTKHIPVYSAYIYNPGSGNRTQTWNVEPQLIRSNLSDNMQTEATLKNQFNISPKDIRDSQAVNADYNNSGLDRGHLNPNGHQNTSISKNATFTLTNAVPMNVTLNRGAWKTYEQQTMRNKTINCQTTYVIVGAVPGNSNIPNTTVNIPSHIWASACCKTKNNTVIAWGAIAENNQVQNVTLGKLEKELAKLYNRGPVCLFHSDCPR
ncbi:ENDD1 protein, partial [Onychorhynchus coronatus]|nr:ENDD1 protein [Onychorhynchus coronatus]